MNELPEIPVDSVVIGERARKDLGDLTELIESIGEIGLVHPITVTLDYTLIAGRRRLAAFRQLGKATIPARVTNQFNDARNALLAERDENTCRKDMTPEELIDMGLALEELERPKARKRQERGIGPAGAEARWRPDASGPSGPDASDQPKPSANRTAEVVGETVGMSRNTYKRAKHVVTTARGENDPDPEVQEVAKDSLSRMNRGETSITGAYQDVRKARAGDVKPKRPKSPPKYGGNRRKHAKQLDAMLTGLSGYQIIADGITDSGLDSSITNGKAAHLTDGLSKALRSLNRINTLLKERSNER
jgi:hypothetical protein